MSNCLNEITQSEFWKIEDAIKRGDALKITGELSVIKEGDDKLYHNKAGNWLRSYKGIYFAHPKLKKFLKG